MSDNIVGKDHLKYVKSQINVRQGILGKPLKDPEDIVWENGRTSWVKLISSVNIADEQVLKYDKTNNQDILVSNSGSEFRNQYLGIEDYFGQTLAETSILSAGLTDYNSMRFGVSETNNSDPSSLDMYGYGGNEFGLKPTPGITNFSTNTNNNGSLRTAQLQFIAHNKNQFNYLETLYLRLGYTMLLEWGNSKFPIANDDGSIRYSTETDIANLSLRDEFLYSFDKGARYFYTRIEELRKQSQGNYDAFLGKVTNFSWQFTKEGSYLITLDIISIGSVVESLKINTNQENIKYLIPTGSSVNPTDEERPSALEVAIDILTNTTSKTETITTPVGDGQGGFDYRTTVTDIISPTKTSLSPEEAQSLNTNEYFYEDILDITPPGGAASSVSVNPNTQSSSASQAQKPKPKTNTVTTAVMACNAAFGADNFTYKYYARLGSLIGFINQKLLLYNKDETSSLISIDGTANNFCYSNKYSFSSDPSKMVNQLKTKINGVDINAFPKIEPFHDTLSDGTPVGRIMNLYFEREFLKQTIRDNSDEDGNLSLYDFLKSLVKTANNLLGGVNKLNLRITTREVLPGIYDEVLEIYDEVPFKKIDTNPVFNIYGFNPNRTEGSFVTGFDLKTEITKDLSSMISIGAQANGQSVGEDATLFSKWNVGLVDRVIPYKLDIDLAKKNSTIGRTKSFALRDSYKRYLLMLADSKVGTLNNKESFGLAYSVNAEFTGYFFPYLYLTTTDDKKPTFNKFTSIQKDFFNKALAFDALEKGIDTPFIGFIPVNLSLQMDGLSGIRIFDKLTVNSEFLPSNYTDTLNFIITQLDHKFEQNKWVTNIGTLSIPKLFDERPEIILDPIIGEEAPFEREDVTSTQIPNYFYTNHRAILGDRQKTRKVSIDEILKGLNGSPSVQAKFRGFLTYLQNELGDGFGYGIKISSAYRNFENSFSVYNNGSRTNFGIFSKTVRSPHFWGMALDLSLYEATEADNGVSSNLLAGFGYDYLDTWRSLGVVDYAINVSKLRWGGTFTDYPDGVHFDAFTPTEYQWADTPGKTDGLASIAEEFINDAYPNLRNLVALSMKGQGLEGANNLPYWFADILDAKNILLLNPDINPKYGFSTSRSLFRGNRFYSFNQESKFSGTTTINY